MAAEAFGCLFRVFSDGYNDFFFFISCKFLFISHMHSYLYVKVEKSIVLKTLKILCSLKVLISTSQFKIFHFFFLNFNL